MENGLKRILMKTIIVTIDMKSTWHIDRWIGIGQTTCSEGIAKGAFANAWEKDTALFEPSWIVVLVVVQTCIAIEERGELFDIGRWTTDAWEFGWAEKTTVIVRRVQHVGWFGVTISDVIRIDHVGVLER